MKKQLKLRKITEIPLKPPEEPKPIRIFYLFIYLFFRVWAFYFILLLLLFFLDFLLMPNKQPN